MTITTVNFDATSDTALTSYGAPDWAYLVAGGGATVDAGGDYLQFNGFGSGVCRARYIGTGTTTGNQDVTATVLVKGFNFAGVLARCSAVADTCYMARIETNETNEVRLYRVVAGTPTLLASWDDGLADGTHTIRMRVTGNGATVSIEVQTNSNTVHTFDDTDGARLTSGQPGLTGETDENYVQLDTWILNDLVSAVAHIPAYLQMLRSNQ